MKCDLDVAKKDKQTLKIVLFCGGQGTRMWPMSRKSKPKQFQPLIGSQSMFAQMFGRLTKGFSAKDIFVVTGREYVGHVVQQAPKLPLENIIVEPEMRDTLAAVGLAATVLDKKFPNTLVAALWGADHLVRNEDEFIKALTVAAQLANEIDCIVEIDVRPTFPSIHLGYIQIGKMVKQVDGLGVFEFVRQVEKPDFETAKKFVQSWEYLWHVGYSVWKTRLMLSLYEKYQPEASQALEKIKESLGTARQDEVLTSQYKRIPKTSIDFAIFEKMQPGNQLVISADLGWTDIGAWDTLKDELAESEEQNVFQGHILDIDSQNCLVYCHSDGKVVATIGLKDLIVVDTPDALLVCAKEKAQAVKNVVEQLKEKKEGKFL